MKKSIIIAFLAAMTLPLFAQNETGKMDDAARIAITPYLEYTDNFNAEVTKQLKNKMNQILTKQGLAGEPGQRFIMVASISVLSEDIVVTTKEMYQYELEVAFIIGDGIEGTKFAMGSSTAKGLGETKAAAYIAALKKIKPNDPAWQQLIADAKKKIIEYYNAKCDFIITEAQTLAKKQDYEEAIYKLTSVPDVCKECYDKCMAAVQPIFQALIDNEGARLLAEATAIWNSGLDGAAAEAAGYVLAQINPDSKAYPGAQQLTAQIGKRVKELDQREWDFKLQVHKDNVSLEQQRIKATRDVGVAFGNHQQPSYHNNLISRW